MPSQRTPSLRRHKTHGLGVVTLNGRDHYLGKWPAGQRKPPPEVEAEYNRLMAEWLANGQYHRRPFAVRADHDGDERFASLHCAGWSMGEVWSATGTCLVSGTKGENAMRAEGKTSAEAWAKACEQAQPVGMLGRRERGS